VSGSVSVSGSSADRVAVVVVRGGRLPLGADEVISECGGTVVMIGEEVGTASRELTAATVVWVLECPVNDLRRIASLAAGAIGNAHVVVLPGSPDGRDVAPLLAAQLGRPLLAGATRIGDDTVTVVRTAGRIGEDIRCDGPFVATMVPGVRGVDRQPRAPRIIATAVAPAGSGSASESAVVHIDVLPPDPTTMDLTEAPVIVAGGQGLGSKERFDQLGRIGATLGASLGGTRVASDAGWIPFERQIGTTGVAVHPRTYLAFAISGATQHTSGLGSPDHVISVNTDPACPMMAMADLAIVADANAVLDELTVRLSNRSALGSVPGSAHGSADGSADGSAQLSVAQEVHP
jgi:electron transfer flavoprotein alpha subunit